MWEHVCVHICLANIHIKTLQAKEESICQWFNPPNLLLCYVNLTKYALLSNLVFLLFKLVNFGQSLYDTFHYSSKKIMQRLKNMKWQLKYQ